ncbi:TetR/AcrR family transcriptional regulator [Streptomyces sp. NBC_00859]|uniref:TetR/AcrR family transcriptional regulator n=1 Tax=Streptomyces sp. NBC_00859 TaxID=2903682 RepID=UPI003863E925|nr:TetR/AcrR family transcriptional regulator [Streptomyces sp. NBC_00859]
MRSKKSAEGQDEGTFVNRARRLQFVECAIEGLVELGFTATTIAEVARRAEVSKSVVLYHFASRSELMEAVMEQVYADAVVPLRAAREAAATERERVLTYVRSCVNFTWTHQKEAQAVLEISRNLRDGDGRLRYTSQGNDSLIAVAQQLLEAGKQAGEFGDFDTWTAAVLLRATIDALSEQFMTNPGVDGPQVAEHLVRLIDRMIPAAQAE